MDNQYPICKYKQDCAAYKNGKCLILTDTEFKRPDCPFYKIAEQLEKENEATIERLLRLGRTDLIERYKLHYGQRKKKR